MKKLLKIVTILSQYIGILFFIIASNQFYNVSSQNYSSSHEYSINQSHHTSNKKSKHNNRNSRRRNCNKNNFRILQKNLKNLLSDFNINKNGFITNSSLATFVSYKNSFYAFKHITGIFRPPIFNFFY